MFTYENISDTAQVIPNVGSVEPGDTIQSEERLHNDNLKQVSKKESEKDD